MTGWLTNNPRAAEYLKRADADYSARIEAAKGLKMADKVYAIREAKQIRQDDYERVKAETFGR